MEVLAAHRRPGLAHLGAQDHRHGVVVAAHRERDPEIANHRRDDVAGPRSVGAAVALATLQADAGGVDRLLPERTEALALERLHAPAHVAAGEELLEAVVDGAGEAHAAQDLLALVGGERRGDGLTLQPAVAGVEHLGPRLLQSADGRHSGRGLVEPLVSGHGVIQAAGELPPEGRAQRVETSPIAWFQPAAADGLEDLEGEADQGGVLLGDERAEARGDGGAAGSGDGSGHGAGRLYRGSGLGARVPEGHIAASRRDVAFRVASVPSEVLPSPRVPNPESRGPPFYCGWLLVAGRTVG